VVRTPLDRPPDPQVARPLVRRTVLDEQVRDLRNRDPRSWGLRTWLGPLVVLAVLAGAPEVLVRLVAPEQDGGRILVAVAAIVGTELVLLGALLAFGRTVAARGGGWHRAFGLDWVRTCDWGPWLLGLAIVYAYRTTVFLVASLATDGRALDEASNLEVGAPTVLSVVVLGLAVAVLAPITEELMFRGLLLRSFMRRMPFWPAALLSTLLFALFHVPQVDTFVGAVTLALSVAVLGLGNCYLVRITGRLAPAMMVHASFNALSLAVAFAAAS
jgi:uncharacterized protein